MMIFMRLRLWIAAMVLMVLIFPACLQDEPDPVEEYEQYGTPFNQVPDTKDVVLYEVNIRAFSPHPNLQGVIDRIDSIKSLGVNVIWLMPIHPIGSINSVNSPYSVKNYKEVNPSFGTLDDLRELTDAAHARGMAVIMDWVANHTAWDNPWLLEHKSWYTQDGSGNVIHPAGTNWQDVADLNYSNDTMRTAMIDAMKYWIYTANVDGFRCDYADGVPFSFWQNAWSSLHSIEGRKFILFAEGTRADHFTAGFDLNFGWQFYGALKNVYAGQSVSTIFAAHANEYQGVAEGKHWVRFTTNHDESAWDATPISLFDGINGALAASVVTIFTGGVPLLYSSQEVGTAQTVPFFSTSTINWSANPEMLHAYQAMLSYYANKETARLGENTVFADDDIACLQKSLNSDTILVVTNLRNSEINWTIPGSLQTTQWVDAFTGYPFTFTESLLLNPYQYLIFQKGLN